MGRKKQEKDSRSINLSYLAGGGEKKGRGSGEKRRGGKEKMLGPVDLFFALKGEE